MTSSSDARAATARLGRSERRVPGRNAEFIGRQDEPRWGMWQLPESELRDPRRRRRPGRARARLRRGAVVDPARRARRAGRGARQLGAAARARPRAAWPRRASTSRSSTPARRRCRSPDASFDVVFCDHGGDDLRRPVPDGAGGGAAAPAGRAVRVLALDAASRCAAARGLASESSARLHAAVLRHAPVRRRARTSRPSTTCRTASGSGSSARTASGSRRSSRCSRPRAPSRPTGRARRPSGRGSWPMEEIWTMPEDADRARSAQPGGVGGVGRRVRRRRRAQLGDATRSPGGSSTSPRRRYRCSADVAGKDVVELGCGTAYVSAWLARRGARVDRRRRDRGAARHRPRGCRPSTGSSSRSSTRAPRTCRCRTRRSTSPSPSTARRSGATPTSGSPRRRGCCVPAASSSSSSTARS